MEVRGKRHSGTEQQDGHHHNHQGHRHHVHFGGVNGAEESDTVEPVHKVEVVSNGDNLLAIHVGFLKAMHRYRVTCRVPVSCCTWHVDEMPNLHWRIAEMRDLGHGAGTELTLHVTARKEKLLREKLTLSRPDPKQPRLTLELNARVLGKNTGTPFLRDGVHLDGVIKEDDDSEASDWKGFDT